MISDVEVVVVGGGAAGIAAARRLTDASVHCLIVEARPRLGGRAWTVLDESGYALDLGCGWLHSAERNPWCAIAEKQGATIDKIPPPWMRPSIEVGFPRAEQDEFHEAMGQFFARLSRLAENEPDRAAAILLEPGCRWNHLIKAVGTYISGAEFDQVSAKDLERYDDSGVNWRVVEGLGTTISKHGSDLAHVLDCPVRRIDHSGRRLRIETDKGVITSDQAIVTLPSALIAAQRVLFMPELPRKTEAALGLPLGLADKLFIALDNAGEFGENMRLFGHTDRTATAGYHLRPFGRPQIEAYFGGSLAHELEARGGGAFFEFAVSELVNLFGSSFARRIRPIRIHCWGSDPFALGSYSYARPGESDGRQTLAEPVDNRLFFAGEACSIADYSTAHGGWRTGVAAADQVIAARNTRAVKQR